MRGTEWLAGTRWYVPTENLLAYLTDPMLRVHTPVADQTLWSITTAADGRFHGTSQTQMWKRTPGGGFEPASSASNTMDGRITADGEITILFTPDDPDQAQTVGYGRLRRVGGEWRMEMQMATGTGVIAMHWAYMTRWMGEEPPAANLDGRALDGSLRAEEWRWLRGTAWSATDQELFPDGATFTIDSYRNGYFWGEGATSAGATLRMAASVTPEGTLYLLFSAADASPAARRGVMQMEEQAPRMAWSQPPGGPVVGGATPA
ncbi:MAG TPA: hypothetical protein VHG08_27140 [Longimicrobium sp.]|nr:hypothetical protein [Longimicrobium sp.]